MKEVNIETAVDSLVRLVNDRKMIALEEAAKNLGVPENIVNEWAVFLEEENILKIIYKMTKPFLIKSEDIKKIAQEKEDVDSERENLIRRVNYILTTIQKRVLKPTLAIKTLEDVKKILMGGYKSKEDILSAQRFVIEKQAENVILALKMGKDIESLKDIENKIDELEKKRDIFVKS